MNNLTIASNFSMDAGEIAELLFGLLLVLWGVGILIARAHTRRRMRRAPATDPKRVRRAAVCSHPAWRVERLAFAGEGQALKISCVRCKAPALDRFMTHALADGTISVVNRTAEVLYVVIAGELHELLPPQEWSPYEDDAAESTYAVYLQPPPAQLLRKPLL